MRVLLVEDEDRLAQTVKEGLVGEGFVVDIVPDGVSAVWAATEFSYDVVVLDIMLPGLNGYDVLKKLRERKIWTPVLMLTAKDGEYDQTDAFDLGADDYLTKPFSFMILVARLRALVRRGAPERPVLISVGTLTLDPSRRHVERRGGGLPGLVLARVGPEQCGGDRAMRRLVGVLVETVVLGAAFSVLYMLAQLIVFGEVRL